MRELQIRARQVDLLGNVELSIAIGKVKGDEWEKAPAQARMGVVKQLAMALLVALITPDGAAIPDKVEPYRVTPEKGILDA
jgi:hypothetical protein